MQIGLEKLRNVTVRYSIIKYEKLGYQILLFREKEKVWDLVN